ncbi:S-adenosyl-L-methionine-dependent methyltransferase [Chloropicon primus]|uniref:S-adenosyl-L-methionine-dependent methyltransferase n=1 Tax=Chloropicon primus TaxID=1764295 RepID=A0A5B8MFJ4_9CHLO|nr:S-adenosyl-L-methionine-dependent methyltransferase [Chloropicon primus]UPQ98290.1 S-adenosyl-L-methionine-dependent methyltransferase [Chloropicon primus]|eukprot:QDZ19081.1 S-adenosyl-L-methionine-dependent methyltransferase [Chloropicon primus]
MNARTTVVRTRARGGGERRRGGALRVGSRRDLHSSFLSREGRKRSLRTTTGSSAVGETTSSPFRLIQHKQEAWWFYRYLSQVYDHIVNPGHWTKDMREDALEPALLHVAKKRPLKVIDVGGGTGFSTTGIVEAGVSPENITLVDQSPHQLAKAKKKPQLQGCTIMEGDAENLQFPTNTFDRYVSCGSIEYWPDPQRGIVESYRVLKPGGMACMVGPVHPTHWLSRFMADAWMLFPTEAEYIKWFEAAGFSSIKLKRIGPKWYRGCRKHGLIMGCSVTGVKKLSAEGESPLKLGEMKENKAKTETNKFKLLLRVVLGSLAGFYYFVIPVYMWLKNLLLPKSVSFV